MCNRKSRLALMLVVLLAGLLLSACVNSGGFYSIRNEHHHMTDGDISNNYTYFRGDRVYSMKLKAGDTLKISITTETGTLGFTVTGPNGDILKETEASGDYQVAIDTEGSWSVTLSASEHKGSYSISW